jgi:TPR repeat protein
MYYNGNGVPQNYSQAAVWYRKAGTQGHSDSLNNLGVGYELGQFGAKNLVLAHIFYNLAAVNGNERARRIAIETQKLTSIQLSEAQELASKWVKGHPLPTITKTYPRSSKKGK